MNPLTNRLSEKLRPFQALSSIWWHRLIATRGREGWLYCARQVYYTMKGTAPLLNFAADVAQSIGFSDEFVQWARLHAEEEKQHYLWYESDLRAMGFDPHLVASDLPSPDILHLLGAQFSLVATVHPVAILGYFYAIECHAPDAAQLRRHADEFGIDDAAIRTMLYHAQADDEHRVEILQLIERCGWPQECFEPMLAGGIEALMGWCTMFKSQCRS